MPLTFLKEQINGKTFKEKRNETFGSDNDAPEFRGTGRKFTRMPTHQRFFFVDDEQWSKQHEFKLFEEFLNQLDWSFIISINWNQNLSECVVIYVKQVEVQNNNNQSQLNLEE